MKKYFYYLNGEINSRQIRSRGFKTKEAAINELSKILVHNNLQVETNRLSKDNSFEEFVCNYYTRFFVSCLR